MIEARQEFNRSIEHLKDMKGEYRQLKKDNVDEREFIKQERRIAEQIKKQAHQKQKPAFFPGIHSNGFLKDSTSVEIGTEFMPWRDKVKLGVPNRCLEDPKSPEGHKWKYQNMH